MKVVIIGAGASGSSCAARLRRLSEEVEILILEKTQESSIASCGLPYYVGNVIDNRDAMQVASPDVFKNLFNISIQFNTEVKSLNTQNKMITTQNGELISYDKLVIACGTSPFLPQIDGMSHLPAFSLKQLADADKIKAFIHENKPQNAVVIGGGFVGVEVAENLCHLNINTTLIEQMPHILPPLDADMVSIIEKHAQSNRLTLKTHSKVQKINPTGVVLETNEEVLADMVVYALGMRPNTLFLSNTDIQTDEKGLIIVNEFMQTSSLDVYACGDHIAVQNFVSKQHQMIALAGPANRQGRLIADHIMGLPYSYSGSLGTGIVKVFDLTAAFVGLNEKQLASLNIPYEKMVITANSHAGYYPNPQELTLKVLYNQDGKILGAQAVGSEGVDKRIDVIATIIRLNGTTQDLRDAELCYAPPYSSAKDPINLIGMAIENVRNGLVKSYFGTTFEDMVVLDVRPPAMHQLAHIVGAINIPAAQIRNRLKEIPKDKTILVHCVRGYTSYVVARILLQNGFKNVLSYAGGWNFYNHQIK